MEQFLVTKHGFFNLRYVKKISPHYSGNVPCIQLINRNSVTIIEILYDQEIKRAHDMKIILGGLKTGTLLIELEYG
jgi:hypothetical protein